MKRSVQKRDIPALTMRGAFTPKSINVEKRSVEVVWTTGSRVLRGYYEKFWEELSLDPKHVRLDRLNDGAPFLANHDGYDVSRTLGVVESAKLDGKRGTAVIRFPAEGISPDADKVFRLVQDGIVQNVSVGYRIHKMEKVEDGEDKIPVFRAVDWEPHEISAVAMGADPGAGFRSDDKMQANPCEFISRGMEPPEESSAMEETAEQKAAREKLEATRAAELKAATEAAAKAERERASGIKLATRAMIALVGAVAATEFADKLIDAGTSLEQARGQVLTELAKRSDEIPTEQHTGSGIDRGEDKLEKFKRGATAWLIHRSGAESVARAVKAGVAGFEDMKDMPRDFGEFRGASLADVARMFLEMNGQRVRTFDRVDIVKRAMAYRSGGLQSTSDFAILLENILHKTLLGAYATTPDTWRRFCKTGKVSDFRTHYRYRNGSFGVLDTLNEAGEFKNKVIPDGEKQSVSVSTVGNMIGLTRQVIVNDDMGAFVGLAERFGRAAALTIESRVYSQLALNSGLGPTQADAQPFFHANRKNVGAGGAAITVATIEADSYVMAAQTDPSGNEILELHPKVLLVPLALSGTAKVLNGAQYDPDTPNKLQRPNVVNGLYSDIIGTARLTGTRRYSFADPAQSNAIEVSFLEGSEGPSLESQEGWRTDGTEWKLRLDFGVDFVDFRGAVTNPGV
jgi:phage head maturation protease